MANIGAHHANGACSNGVFGQLKVTIGTVRTSLPHTLTIRHWFLGVLPRDVPNQVHDRQPAEVDLGRFLAVVQYSIVELVWVTLNSGRQPDACVPGLYLVSKVGTNRMSPEMRR